MRSNTIPETDVPTSLRSRLGQTHQSFLKEARESWILLQPGEFYGATVPLSTVQLSPGTWKVVGRRSPPRVTDELREQLRMALKFPVLLETVDSKPVFLKVAK